VVADRAGDDAGDRVVCRSDALGEPVGESDHVWRADADDSVDGERP
jgi:hypothetical protein